MSKLFALVGISLSCYYLPVIAGFDYSNFLDYKQYHYLFASCRFFELFMFSFFLYYYCTFEKWKEKLILFVIAILNFYTFLDYIINKYLIGYQGFNELSSISFIITFIFFLFLVIKDFNNYSDEYNPVNSYLVIFVPKNILGVLPFLFFGFGHLGILFNGKIYKFSKRTKMIEKREFKHLTNKFYLRKINIKISPEAFIGVKFRLIKFNCLSFARLVINGQT